MEVQSSTPPLVGFPFGCACVCVFQECGTLSPAEGAVELHIYLLQHCVIFSHLLGGKSHPVAGGTLFKYCLSQQIEPSSE